MKRIELIELKLQNFQGGSFTLKAEGQDTDIFAVNGAGKTRLFSAFTYLLFGKDSMGRSEYSLKNLDEN
jgi:DNA repair exonuclease SbcCD ATPase subunit